MKNFDYSNFTFKQIQTIILLSVGTFLEYFDLMLYVHMAIFLNELFFPINEEYSSAFLSAFAFCSTYVLRPFGALIFGWFGDNWGRKSAIIISTGLMSLSSLLVAIMPTYVQIGVIASIGITICRIIQGISSMGELVAAEIYLTETTTPPKQYFAVSAIDFFGAIGGLFALFVAFYITSLQLNWRLAFIFGSCVAVVGTIARNKLKETSEFLKEKELKREPLSDYHHNLFKTSLAMFFVQSSISPYLCFIFCGNILIEQFGFDKSELIYQNLCVALIGILSRMMLLYLCTRIYPLILIKISSIISLIFILFLPYLLNNISTSSELFLIQCFLSFFIPSSFPAGSIFYKYFPITKRFTYSATIFACAKSFMAIISSLGLVYLVNYYGYIAILFILIPIYLAFYWAISYFHNLEKINEFC
jgi:MFS family permease